MSFRSGSRTQKSFLRSFFNSLKNFFMSVTRPCDALMVLWSKHQQRERKRREMRRDFLSKIKKLFATCAKSREHPLILCKYLHFPNPRLSIIASTWTVNDVLASKRAINEFLIASANTLEWIGKSFYPSHSSASSANKHSTLRHSTAHRFTADENVPGEIW